MTSASTLQAPVVDCVNVLMKLFAARGTQQVHMRFLLVIAVLAGCTPRDLVLGAQIDAGEPVVTADAGPSLKAASPPAALSRDVCLRAPSLSLPGACFGGSGPAPSECLLAHAPDGGLTLLASVDRASSASFGDVFWVGFGRVFAEVREPSSVTLRSYDLRTGAAMTHVTLSYLSDVVAAGFSRSTIDVVSCEYQRCQLLEVPLDGGVARQIANDVPRPDAGVVTPDQQATPSWAWSTANDIVRVSGSSRSVLSSDPLGAVTFGLDGRAYVSEFGALVRFDAATATTLATGLDEPRGLFVVSGYVIAVESRAVRAFPLTGGAPLMLYELGARTGTLEAPRLIEGRLVFDQLCLDSPAVRGNVEVDFNVGQARWLNEVPGYPFVSGANPGTLGNLITASPTLILRATN